MGPNEQPNPRDRARSFSIGDVLILIAGLAAGLALVRAASPELTPGQLRAAFLSPQGGWTPFHAFGLTLELGMVFLLPIVAAWTPACLLLQLSRPRPPWRRLRRQPGFIACLLATALTIATIAIAVLLLAMSVWDLGTSPGRYLKALVLGGLLSGVGVGTAGATLVLSGVWRPVPTWTDRLGRLTGAAWIVAGAISLCYAALSLD